MTKTTPVEKVNVELKGFVSLAARPAWIPTLAGAVKGSK